MSVFPEQIAQWCSIVLLPLIALHTSVSVLFLNYNAETVATLCKTFNSLQVLKLPVQFTALNWTTVSS